MDKKQFFNLFNNSLKIIIDDNLDSIFYVYNESIERQIKYNRLFNLNKPIKYTLNINDILFEQDIKKKYLWYDYNKIFLKLKKNNKYKKMIINNLIKSWLDNDTNWKQYTPCTLFLKTRYELDNDINWKQYTPQIPYTNFSTKFNNNINWKQYTYLS